MIIEPKIRSNIALNSHPIGCEKNIINQLNDIKNLTDIGIKPLNVLIVGGSSGYGLASRLVMAFKNQAFTYNVSFESAPTKRNSGSAGYFNNYYFEKIADENNIKSYDLNADCFAHETKDEVIKYFKENNLKIDLIIYSVASGVRVDPDTQEKYISALKPIDNPYQGITVDMVKETLEEKIIEPASEEEIKNTIKVMGGEDFLLWIKALDNADVLNENVKALAYTYIGSPCTYDIYKNGTIGQAKRDLEAKNHLINEILEKYQGNSYIVSAKSVVTKASNFIPTVPIYVSTVYKVMKKHNVHESIIEHIYRLFSNMIYGDKILLDENGIVRLDAFELDENIQKEVIALMEQVTEDNFMDLVDYQVFKNEFLQINGFNFDDVDYTIDIDLTKYEKPQP